MWRTRSSSTTLATPAGIRTSKATCRTRTVSITGGGSKTCGSTNRTSAYGGVREALRNEIAVAPKVPRALWGFGGAEHRGDSGLGELEQAGLVAGRRL